MLGQGRSASMGMMIEVLLHLAYLTITKTFTVLRLLRAGAQQRPRRTPHSAIQRRTQNPPPPADGDSSPLTCYHTRLTNSVDAPGPQGSDLRKCSCSRPPGRHKTLPTTFAGPATSANPSTSGHHSRLRYLACSPSR